MRLLRAAVIIAMLLGAGLSALAAPTAAPPGDVGGITLGELFNEPVDTLSQAASALGDATCLIREFAPARRVVCNAAALYESALLFDYCGTGNGPYTGSSPWRLEQLGSTDLELRRRVEAQHRLIDRQDAYIEARCEPLRQRLQALPTLTDERRQGIDDPLLARRSNLRYLRFHAALLGELRAMRWMVLDWLVVGGGPTDPYVPIGTVQAALEHVRFEAPAEWHRLASQLLRLAPPWLELAISNGGMASEGEARVTDAAAHLLAWRRVAASYYDQPADLRWLHLKERSFLGSLTENQMSLAIHRASEMLAERPIEPRRSAGESATPPGLRSP